MSFTIINKRIVHTDDSTLGVLYLNSDRPFSFIIEDEPRKKKVPGETRIPAGTYELGIRKELTPLTVKHRNNSVYKSWFKYHIEVLNVPGFSGIYFHIGNNEHDTEGCQMPNYEVNIINGEFVGRKSIQATRYFYEIVYPKLEKGEKVLYKIIDNDRNN